MMSYRDPQGAEIKEQMRLRKTSLHLSYKAMKVLMPTPRGLEGSRGYLAKLYPLVRASSIPILAFAIWLMIFSFFPL